MELRTPKNYLFWILIAISELSSKKIVQIYTLKTMSGNSLAVQWLGLHALMAKSLGSIPGQETKISRAVYRSQKKTVRNCPFPLDNTGINLLNFLNNLVGL